MIGPAFSVCTSPPPTPKLFCWLSFFHICILFEGKVYWLVLPCPVEIPDPPLGQSSLIASWDLDNVCLVSFSLDRLTSISSFSSWGLLLGDACQYTGWQLCLYPQQSPSEGQVTRRSWWLLCRTHDSFAPRPGPCYLFCLLGNSGLDGFRVLIIVPWSWKLHLTFLRLSFLLFRSLNCVDKIVPGLFGRCRVPFGWQLLIGLSLRHGTGRVAGSEENGTFCFEPSLCAHPISGFFG